MLRPGGRFVLVEQVRSPVRAVRGASSDCSRLRSSLSEPTICCASRLKPMQAEGFSIELLERSKLGLVERLVARKPGIG